MNAEKNKTEAPAPVQTQPSGQARVKTYILANVIFWAYLIGMFLIAHFMVGDTSGLFYVLGVMGVAFTLVSIADYASDRSLDKNIESQ